MLESFLIVFRETLEASLIVGIIGAQINNRKPLYWGIGLAVLTSILLALLFSSLASGFTGTVEQVFEGTTMILGALLLSSMIIWMTNYKQNITKKIKKTADHSFPALGIFLIVFLSIIREGVETIIFLHAVQFAGGVSIIASFLGLLLAIAIGYAFFKYRFSIKHFFTFSTILLIFFSAGLIAHGVHEFEEAGLISGIIYPLYDINPEVVGDTYPALHEKGAVGSIAKGLFGYNGNPSLLETIAYLLSLGTMLLFFFTHRKG